MPVEFAETMDFPELEESLAQPVPPDHLETVDHRELLEQAVRLEQLVQPAPVGFLDQRGTLVLRVSLGQMDCLELQELLANLEIQAGLEIQGGLDSRETPDRLDREDRLVSLELGVPLG